MPVRKVRNMPPRSRDRAKLGHPDAWTVLRYTGTERYSAWDQGFNHDFVAYPGNEYTVSEELATRLLRQFPTFWQRIGPTVKCGVPQDGGKPVYVIGAGPEVGSVGRLTRTVHEGLLQLGLDSQLVPVQHKVPRDSIVVYWGGGAPDCQDCFKVRLDPIDTFHLKPDEVAHRNQQCDVLFGLSHASCAQLRAMGVQNVEWLPVGIDREVFSEGVERRIPQAVFDNSEWFGDRRRPEFWFGVQFAYDARKGGCDLVTAFCETFTANAPVGLILKSQEQPRKEKGVRGEDLVASGSLAEWLAPFGEDHPPIVYSRAQLSMADQARFYAGLGAYVSASRMEGWGLPPLEAMGCGTPVIVTATSGHLDYATNENCYLVSCHDEPVEAMPPRLEAEQAAQLTWGVANRQDLREAMTLCYDMPDTVKRRRQSAMTATANLFSYAYTAVTLVEALARRGQRIRRVHHEGGFAIRPEGSEAAGPGRAQRFLCRALEDLGYRVRVLDNDEPTAQEVQLRWGPPTSTPQGPCACFHPVDSWRFSPQVTALLSQQAVTFGLGQDSTDAIRALGVTNTEPLPLGVDLRDFPRRTERGPLPGFNRVLRFGRWHKTPFRFLVVASVQPRKNLWQLLDAYRKAFAEEPVELWLKVSLHGWGEDPTERIAAEWPKDAPGIALVTEDLAAPAMLALYHACDCCVSASLVEGWGWGGLEAMACGLQVVLTDAPGHRDYADAKACTIIPTERVTLAECPEVAAATQKHGLLPNVAASVPVGRATTADIAQALRIAYRRGKPSTATLGAQARVCERFTPSATVVALVDGLRRHGITVPEPKPRPTVAVCIPVWNNREQNVLCLDALAKTRGVDLQVIVRDDASEDGTAEWLQARRGDPFPLHLILEEERGGLFYGRQRLADAACALEPRPEYLCFLDGDIVDVDPDWLANLAAHHRDGISTGKIMRQDGRIWEHGLYWGPGGGTVARGRDEEDLGQYDWPCLCDFASGAVMFTRTSLWAEGRVAMPLDAGYAFGAYDDAELAAQVRFNCGEHCWFWPDSRVVHYSWWQRPQKPGAFESGIHEQSKRVFFKRWGQRLGF